MPTKKSNKKRYKDLTGLKLHKWTVIKKCENKHRYWLCKCECGTEKEVYAANLVNNKTKSCGCSFNTFVPANKLPVADAAFNLIFSSYKKRAREKQRSFVLTEDQFKDLIFQNCYYCEGLPSNFRNYKSKDNFIFKYNGIDRIDSSIGYELDNCVPCCSTCNYMKQDITLDIFFKQIEKIYHLHLKKEGE